MFNKISDIKEAWAQGIINLYPAAYKNLPGTIGTPTEGSNTGLSFEQIDENEEQWLAEVGRKNFSHAYYWDKSPFESFEELKNVYNGKLGKVTGWCVLIGRGSNKPHLKEDDGELRLACIDIDGYKPKDKEKSETDKYEIRKRSCDEIYNAISENANFDFFAERSQGGGYHIWYLTRQQVLTKQLHHLNNLMFPKGSEFEGLVLNDRKNNLNRNKEFVEVFSKGGAKYVSCSPTNKYEFVDDKPVELLKMKPVEDINTELKKALIKAGFITI